MDFPQVDVVAAAGRGRLYVMLRGEYGDSAPPHGPRTAGHGSVRGRGGHPDLTAKCRRRPKTSLSGGADRIAHAVSSARPQDASFGGGLPSLPLWRLLGRRRQPPQEDQEPTTAPGSTVPAWAWDRPGGRSGGSALCRRGGLGPGRQERRICGSTLRRLDSRGRRRGLWGTPWGAHAGGIDEKGFSRKCQPFPPGASAFFDAEGNLPIFECFQAVVGQGNPVDIGCKVGEDLRTSPRGLAVGHPGRVPDLGRYGRVEARRWSTPLCTCHGRAWRGHGRARARPRSGGKATACPLGTGRHQGQDNGHGGW